MSLFTIICFGDSLVKWLSKKQYRNLSNKKKRQAKLGSSDIEKSDLRLYKQQQEKKKSYSWVYKNYS